MYDIHCVTAAGTYIVAEWQTLEQKYFLARSVTCSAFPIAQQALEGGLGLSSAIGLPGGATGFCFCRRGGRRKKVPIVGEVDRYTQPLSLLCQIDLCLTGDTEGRQDGGAIGNAKVDVGVATTAATRSEAGKWKEAVLPKLFSVAEIACYSWEQYQEYRQVDNTTWT